MRKKLVNSLRKKGIRDECVLEAMDRIPRHLFLDKAFEEWAYRDIPFPIGHDQTISQPYTVAYQTQLLKIERPAKILEIGTGSGYQACVLAEMGAKVYSIERVKSLFEITEKRLAQLGYERIRTFYRDGNEGLPRFAPFDRILVTAAAREVPQNLLDQLVVNGMLVIPFGKGKIQKMLRITRHKDGKFNTEEFGQFRFVPLLPGMESRDANN